MIIKTKELMKLLKEHGRIRVIHMITNEKIFVTEKQFDMVFNYRKETKK